MNSSLYDWSLLYDYLYKEEELIDFEEISKIFDESNVNNYLPMIEKICFGRNNCINKRCCSVLKYVAEKFNDIFTSYFFSNLQLLNLLYMDNNRDDFYLHPVLKSLIDSIEVDDFRTEYFELLNNGYIKGSILEFIRNDDVESLINYTISNPDVDFNKALSCMYPDLDHRLTVFSYVFWTKFRLISIAAYYGSYKCFKFMLDSQGVCIDDYTLGCALTGCNKSIVSLLEKMNYNISEHIDIAVRYFRNDFVEYILSNYNVETNNLLEAFSNYNIPVINYVLSVNPDGVNVPGRKGYNALHWASFCGDTSLCQMLIDRKVNVNSESTKRKNPLIIATLKNHIELCRLYVVNGVDINTAGENGNTALHFSCQNNTVQISEFLILSGANLEAKNENLNTPLHVAALLSHFETCKLLLDRGANINVKNNTDFTPLHMVCKTNNVELCRLFLSYGADVNAKDEFDQTPLLIAVSFGHLDQCKLLLENGASVNEMVFGGFTPLHTASCMGFKNICELLISYGADVNSGRDLTPLYIAELRGNEEVVEYLTKIISSDTDN